MSDQTSVTPSPEQPKKKMGRGAKIVLWVVGVLIALVIFGNLMPDASPEKDAKDDTSTSEESTPKVKPSPAKAAETAPEKKATPESKFTEQVRKSLGDLNRDGKRIDTLNYNSDTKNATVSFRLNDNFSDGLIKTSAQLDTVDVLKAVKSSGLNLNEVTIRATFTLEDEFGNVSESEVVQATYSAATLEKMNLDSNRVRKGVWDLADSSTVHPTMQGD